MLAIGSLLKFQCQHGLKGAIAHTTISVTRLRLWQPTMFTTSSLQRPREVYREREKTNVHMIFILLIYPNFFLSSCMYHVKPPLLYCFFMSCMCVSEAIWTYPTILLCTVLYVLYGWLFEFKRWKNVYLCRNKWRKLNMAEYGSWNGECTH